MLIYSAVKRIFKHFNAQQIVCDKRLYASAHSRFTEAVGTQASFYNNGHICGRIGRD